MGSDIEKAQNRSIEQAAQTLLRNSLNSWLEFITSMRIKGNDLSPAVIKALFKHQIATLNDDDKLRLGDNSSLIEELLSPAPMKVFTPAKTAIWQEFSFDPNTRIAQIHNVEEELPPVESYCFGLLVQAQGTAVPFALFRYDPIYNIDARSNQSVRTHISRILTRFPGSREPLHIINLSRQGYRLASCATTAGQ